MSAAFDFAELVARSTSVLAGMTGADVCDLAWEHDVGAKAQRWDCLSRGEQRLCKIALALRDIEVLAPRVDDGWRRKIAIALDDVIDIAVPNERNP